MLFALSCGIRMSCSAAASAGARAAGRGRQRGARGGTRTRALLMIIAESVGVGANTVQVVMTTSI